MAMQVDCRRSVLNRDIVHAIRQAYTSQLPFLVSLFQERFTRWLFELQSMGLGESVDLPSAIS
jgi:hypothetical protein